MGSDRNYLRIAHSYRAWFKFLLLRPTNDKTNDRLGAAYSRRLPSTQIRRNMSTVYFPATNKYSTTRQWDLKYIWELSESLPVEEIDVQVLWDRRYGKAWCWQHEDEVINNDFFLHHMQRVMDANLSYPIILSEEGYIFDGVHRLMKCKYLGIEKINCVKFIKDPEPSNVQ